jgi:hypothetical protein
MRRMARGAGAALQAHQSLTGIGAWPSACTRTTMFGSLTDGTVAGPWAVVFDGLKSARRWAMCFSVLTVARIFVSKEGNG